MKTIDTTVEKYLNLIWRPGDVRELQHDVTTPQISFRVREYY